MDKLNKGDYVIIENNCDWIISDKREGEEAIVLHDNHDGSAYSIFVKGEGQIAWYDRDMLTLLETNRVDLLDKWRDEKKVEEKMKSNLDWIFENGKKVAKSPHGASIEALAKCLGFNNLWPGGEGITYLQNYITVLEMAPPYLESEDKQGWLDFSEIYKNKLKGHEEIR